ncbi:MAG: 5-formyltetrahydrofolate cyclo-ligase [Nannocystaceae bacterium]
MTDLQARKQHARTTLLARRREQDKLQRATRSTALQHQILQSEVWQQAPIVVAFVGVRGEPLTDDLLVATLAAGKQLVLPRVSDDRKVIEFFTLPTLDALVPGTFGLREPPPHQPYDLASDPRALLLIPGLGFTRHGCRLGFGKGHYDRALACVASSHPPTRVGVCFDEALDPAGLELPRDTHDVLMHRIVTDRAWVTCPLESKDHANT